MACGACVLGVVAHIILDVLILLHLLPVTCLIYQRIGSRILCLCLSTPQLLSEPLDPTS